ncbi:MAG: SdiA-regulated domain-containing protein [Saprospiraceae bacterium]
MLLIALKQDPVSDTVRCIMGFDLNKQKLLSEPVYRIDPNEVNKLVPDGPEDKPNYLSPSGVAIHPLTQDVYVLSSAKKRLVVLDYNSGAIKYATRISKELLPQPEGICFDPAGNLFISSEAKKGLPKILKFEPKKP